MALVPLHTFHTVENGESLPLRVRMGLLHLYEAHEFAEHFGMDTWQYAVEIETLYKVGMTATDCRWLVDGALAACAQETTAAGKSERKFRHTIGSRFSQQTCFTLTSGGVAFIRDTLQLVAHVELPPDDIAQWNPSWNRERRELRLGPTIVKHYKLPAPNQEIVLQAFAEEGWPRKIDDPLPYKAGHDPKRRLHDTINSLNRNQKHVLMHFHGDGTGRGICWEPVTNGFLRR